MLYKMTILDRREEKGEQDFIIQFTKFRQEGALLKMPDNNKRIAGAKLNLHIYECFFAVLCSLAAHLRIAVLTDALLGWFDGFGYCS